MRGAGRPQVLRFSGSDAGSRLPGWNDLELSTLSEKQREASSLRFAGHSEREIARRLRVARTSVRGRLDRAAQGLRRHHKDQGRRAWATDMLASDPALPGRLSAEHARALVLLYASGASLSQIAAAKGHTVPSVKNRLKRWRTWWLRESDRKT